MVKFFNKHGKKLMTAMLALMLVMTFVVPAYASTKGLYEDWKPDSIAKEIGKGGGADTTEILQKIDEQVANIVGTVRVIAAIFAVIFVIWIGVVFLTSGGNPQRLVQVKTQIVLFFLSLVCIFMAEPIVRFFLSWVVKH